MMSWVALLQLLASLRLSCGPAATPLPAGRVRSFAWYRLSEPWLSCVPPEDIQWSALTHIALAAPTILPNFTAVCNASTTEKRVSALAKAHGVKVIWIVDEDIFPSNNRSVLVDPAQRHAFLSTVGTAAAACGVDGVDADFEGWDDPQRKGTTCAAVGSDCDWNVYTDFLNGIRDALNVAVEVAPAAAEKQAHSGLAAQKTVSACLGNWNLVSWVNPKRFKGDWVSLMSYSATSYDNASVADYRAQGEIAVRAGLRKSMINIGLGTYSSGGEWCQASAACPNLDPAARFCSGPGANSTHICSTRDPSWNCAKGPGPHCGPEGGCPVPLGGKNSAMEIGQMLREEGYGAFIWELNYDTSADNNSLTAWIEKGLRSGGADAADALATGCQTGCDCESSGLHFHAPTLVGPGSGYASNFQAISDQVFFGASLHDYITIECVATTDNASFPPRYA